MLHLAVTCLVVGLILGVVFVLEFVLCRLLGLGHAFVLFLGLALTFSGVLGCLFGLIFSCARFCCC